MDLNDVPSQVKVKHKTVPARNRDKKISLLALFTRNITRSFSSIIPGYVFLGSDAI